MATPDVRFAVGDEVLFAHNPGEQFPWGGETFRVIAVTVAGPHIREQDILRGIPGGVTDPPHPDAVTIQVGDERIVVNGWWLSKVT